MNYLESVFNIAIIFFASYKIIELFIRKKERLLIVDKLDKMDLSKESNLNLSNLFGNSDPKSNWPLRIGCLLLGLGLGALIGYVINLSIGLYCENSGVREVYNQIATIYSSCTLIFGGGGLLAAYLIEKKQNKK